MRAPLVAVPAYRLPAGRVAHWDQGGFAVPEAYVRAAHRAGIRALIVAEADPDAAVDVLDSVDGLMLLGGGDVDPTLYGADRHEKVYGVDPVRDAVEIALVRSAIERGMPTLAICRGLQVLNVALGGTLIQHLPDVPGLEQHGVPGGGGTVQHDSKVSPDTALAAATGSDVLVCSSHHHQAVDRLGDGLHVTARSGDGVIEAIELDDPGWTVAVQWHPEDTAGEDPAQQALFDALASKAAAFAGARSS
ncbi:MAG TPA: gamma-glutamyl-gamma-aminobutyrate hydrolase family protein [Actinomycetota bacterium]|nr:gamma-glutamyl-gamma-aminobutyrate hydrolase family protein [Actinomycetota bacterium]